MFSYRNAINSLIRVRRDEGLKGLFNGATIAAMRAGVTTAGYLSVYDQVRMALIYSGFNENNINVYIMSVIIAVIYSLINLESTSEFLIVIFLANHCYNDNTSFGCS